MKSNKLTKAPRVPADLTQRAGQLWKTINEEFELGSDAVQLLRIALENMDLGDAARAKLRAEGPVLSNGKKNPLLDACKQFDGTFLRSMRQLGLDVVARDEVAGRRR